VLHDLALDFRTTSEPNCSGHTNSHDPPPIRGTHHDVDGLIDRTSNDRDQESSAKANAVLIVSCGRRVAD
jgi:hypothetical protein